MIISSKSQTLITGVYRTGSEYLAQLIGGNDEISVSMYSINILRFVYGKYDPFNVKENYLKALNHISERVSSRYQIRIDKVNILKELDALPIVTYGNFYDLIMSSLYLNSNTTNWAEKNQLLWREIPEFIKIMPNGRAILILRDPRSVLVSFKQYTYAPSPAYLEAVFNCFDAMNFAKKFQNELNDKVLVVRYEDIAANPKLETEKCWNFLGINPNKLTAKELLDAYGNNWQSNSSFHEGCMTQSDLFDSVNRWKNRITNAELNLTEGICGELMNYFGYKPKLNGLINWPGAIRLFIDDENLKLYFRNWLVEGVGIEAFPSDPLKPENWRQD